MRNLRSWRRTLAACVGTAALAITFLPGTAAQASPQWAAFQPGLPYTVYEAYDSVGLTRTSLGTSSVCNTPGTPQTVLKAVFRSGTKKIKLFESSFGCSGQGTAYAPIAYTQFPVQGGAGTASVFPACYTQLQCEFPSNATIRDRGAYVKVLLQSDGVHSATYVDVYTVGVSLTKIKSFVWGLGLP